MGVGSLRVGAVWRGTIISDSERFVFEFDGIVDDLEAIKFRLTASSYKDAEAKAAEITGQTFKRVFLFSVRATECEPGS